MNHIHGSYPQATGLNINPLATILSAAMMFEDAFDYMKRLLQ
jgi:3-isopropylmalate dehydrogenase